MSDLIERQAVIDWLKYKWNCSTDSLFYGIQELPSAQPEQAVKDCRNCKHGNYNDHWGTHFCFNPNECTEWDLWEPSAQPEVIRCKDCKHWEYDAIFSDGWCRGKQQGNPEWFCADAERRSDA